MFAHAIARYFPVPSTKQEADIWAAKLFLAFSCVLVSLIVAGIL